MGHPCLNSGFAISRSLIFGGYLPSLYRACKLNSRVSKIPLNFDIHKSVNSEVSNKGLTSEKDTRYESAETLGGVLAAM